MNNLLLLEKVNDRYARIHFVESLKQAENFLTNKRNQ